MFRLLFYLAFGYLVWRFIQVVMRSMSNSSRDQGDTFASRGPQKPPQNFKDVQDAEFEELPPDEKK